jgi:hypothetical protein
LLLEIYLNLTSLNIVSFVNIKLNGKSKLKNLINNSLLADVTSPKPEFPMTKVVGQVLTSSVKKFTFREDNFWKKNTQVFSLKHEIFLLAMTTNFKMLPLCYT